MNFNLLGEKYQMDRQINTSTVLQRFGKIYFPSSGLEKIKLHKLHLKVVQKTKIYKNKFNLQVMVLFQ